MKRLREYRWSSYRAYAGYAPAQAWLTTEAILARAAGAPDEQRRPYREEVRQLLIEEVVGAVEAVRGAPAATWLTQHGAPCKGLVLRLARRLCGLALTELGQRLDGLDYAAVGMALRRLDARLPQDPRLRRIYDQAADKLHVKT